MSEHDTQISARQGRVIEAFLRAGHQPDQLLRAGSELRSIEALPRDAVVSWALTVGGRRAVFAPHPDGSLCHPLVLGSIIEQNRVGAEPCEVVIDVTMVRGRTSTRIDWPVADEDVVDALTRLAAAPSLSDEVPERSSIRRLTLNLGRAGKLRVHTEHDHDPSTRWHLPRVRVQTSPLTVQVGWWDRAVALIWQAGRA